jgi:hypothetical protein
MGIAGRGLVNAGVNSAINGTSFGEGFKQSVINDAAAIGASAIGTAWGGGKDPVMQTVAHAGLGAITAKLRGQDVVAGAIGGATESVLGNLVSDSAVSGNGGKALYAAAATLAGGIVANALGRDAVTAGQTAQNAALNNRLLHKDETALAKKLAAQSNGKYTEAQVADALRWANNKNYGETASSNIVTPESAPKTDAMISGKTTEASTPYLSAPGQDGNVRVQNMAQVAKPSNDLMTYIQQNTGSTYSWNTNAWTSSATPANANTQKYAYYPVNGGYQKVPVVDCPAAGCANGSPIAWASTNPDDQKLLADYVAASNKQDGKAAVNTAITVGAVAVAPATLAGTVAAGAVIGGGTSAADQYIDKGTVDATKTTKDTVVGAAVGGVTYGIVKGAAAASDALDALLPSSTKTTNGAVAATTPVSGNPTIQEIQGPTSFVVNPMSQVPSNLTAGERLGNFGEDLARPVLDSLSPGYRPLQNASGNGSDGIGIADPATKTIPAFEIKTTDSGNRQSVGDLVDRTAKWINDAAGGSLNNQKLNDADVLFAQELQVKLKEGYVIKPYVVEVAVPPQGQAASPVVTVIPYPRPTPMPTPTTAPYVVPPTITTP